MRLAVTQGVSARAPTLDQKSLEAFRRYINDEVRTLLDQLRRSANSLNAEPIAATVSDGAGTYLVVWTSGVAPLDGTFTLKADVQGDSATVYASYGISQEFRSLAGTISAVAPMAFDRIQESAAGCDARYTIDSTNRVITLDVCDNAVVAMTWNGTAYAPSELMRE